jgi:hypothetical protein
MPALSRLARWSVAAISVGSAALLALAVQAGAWWSVGEVEIGPAGSSHCFGGACRPSGLAWVGGGDTWFRLGMATWAAGLISAVVLVLLAAGTAAGRAPTIAARTALVAAGCALVTGVAFVVMYPGVPGASVDRGLPFFFAGVVGALVAALLVLRKARA